MSRQRVLAFLAALSLGTLTAPGCKRHSPSAPAAPASSAAAEPDRGGGRGGGGGDDEEDGSRRHRPTIYVDGKPIVAFAYNELPPGVKVTERLIDAEEHVYYKHINFADLVKNLGVDLRQVKAVHFHGGLDRVAVLDGDEVRRQRDKLFINFCSEMMGKPRVEWTRGIRTNDTPDTVRDLAIYVHKAPPRWDADNAVLVDEQGREIEGIPYATESIRGGVRVNLDGRLAATIKRNLLEGNVPALNEGRAGEEPRYALTAFLESNHLKLGEVRGIDLVTYDERILRLSNEEAKGGLTFTAPRQSGGAVNAYFGTHWAPVAAINVYARLSPPTRPSRTVTLGPSPAAWGESTHGGKPQVRGRK